MRRKYRQPKTRAQTRPRPKSVVMAAAAATAAAEAAEAAEAAAAAAVGCARDGAERREVKMRRIG